MTKYCVFRFKTAVTASQAFQVLNAVLNRKVALASDLFFFHQIQLNHIITLRFRGIAIQWFTSVALPVSQKLKEKMLMRQLWDNLFLIPSCNQKDIT